MNCGRCGIPLQPGSAHLNETSCLEALRAKLTEVSSCAGCKQPIAVHVCPKCAAQAFGKGLLNKATQAAGPSLLNWLQGLGQGGPAPEKADEPWKP